MPPRLSLGHQEAKRPIGGLGNSDPRSDSECADGGPRADRDGRSPHQATFEGAVDPECLTELTRPVAQDSGRHTPATAHRHLLALGNPNRPEQHRRADSGGTGHEIGAPVEPVRPVNVPVAWRGVDADVSGVAPAPVRVGRRVVPSEICLGFNDHTPDPLAPGFRDDHRPNQIPSNGLGRAGKKTVW